MLISDLVPEPGDTPTVVLAAVDVDQAAAEVAVPAVRHAAEPGVDFWAANPDAVRVGGAARHAARESR